MDKLITVKLVLAVACISLTLVAFANKNQQTNWQITSVNFVTASAKEISYQLLSVNKPVLKNTL
ncbi:hypothetical protein [Legionella jamestowniensis]|uniref:Uncharacterized protein n=1 Tax=Legionella jamestowniensis TaxID=455 RepID=A0A0W0UYS7_9GAMM|nr:hypothetical protein [Legionella jamestowniensis]KTD13026.1 hypothetical protein Ljam_0284 [Legionella jamestowniensis]OCH98194.1 hypothetical protein A8135_11530 [Legionella jamestowniensis]SFL79653.1 hypothetical protein SAMN02746073_2002 [Legionella jamestowniensis DSM 19215]